MIQTRWSPTLGELEGTAEHVWNTAPYELIDNPTVFFGMYGLQDLMVLRRHKGKRWILWAGTDITHLIKGFFLDEIGRHRIDAAEIGPYLNEVAENWCENDVEREALSSMGIDAKVCPSFMGNINNFEITYKPSAQPKVYLSVSGDEFIKYGWDVVERIAEYCNADFYLYGNTKPWETRHDNVHIKGRVLKEVMNNEIKDMQCALRPVSFDGFSEILAKAVLQGQYAISKIEYPLIGSYDSDEDLVGAINALTSYSEPNVEARDYYRKTVNNFPWNTN